MRFLLLLFSAIIAVSCNFKSKAKQTAGNTPQSLLAYPATDSAGLLHVIIEIPAGSVEKREVDKTTGRLAWPTENGKPRKINYLPYPVNYGMVPHTLLAKAQGGDGDPLDVILLGPALPTGSLQKAKYIGVMHLSDDGERDDKLIAITNNTAFTEVTSLQDLEADFAGITKILALWFENYKGSGAIQFKGYSNADSAATIIKQAIAAYQTKK